MAALRLELYVVGHTRNSQAAVDNIRKLCEQQLRGNCDLHIVDILEQPDAAEAANIVATPTLIRRTPLPVRRIVGDLSLIEIVLETLDLDITEPVPTDKGSS